MADNYKDRARIKIEPVDGSAKAMPCELIKAESNGWTIRLTFREVALPVIDGRPRWTGPVAAYLLKAFRSQEPQAVSIMSGDDVVEKRTAVVSEFETWMNETDRVEYAISLAPLERFSAV